MGNTCKTCINNDDGLCDRKGILVEDEDFCEHHWAAGKKIRMKRHMLLVPEPAVIEILVPFLFSPVAHTILVTLKA